MKIQDIFKLNTNTRGGVKLFNRIMGRYNIPKQDSKQLIKEIRNSSNGDSGGIKEYYYKVINEQAYNAIKGFPFVLISGIIAYRGYEYVYAPHLGDIEFLAFRITDIEMTYWGYIEYNKIDRGIILKGDLYERATLGLNAAGQSISIEDVKNQFGTLVQEITKEEYESLITHKP